MRTYVNIYMEHISLYLKMGVVLFGRTPKNLVRMIVKRDYFLLLHITLISRSEGIAVGISLLLLEGELEG